MANRWGFWPCCAAEEEPDTGNCTACGNLANTWRFTMSGLSDDQSLDCTLFNGTFDLTIATLPGQDNCGKTLSLGGGMNGESIELFFGIVGTTIVSVIVRFSTADGSADYRKLVAVSCPLGVATEFELSFLGQVGDICTGWPSTLTITAIPTP